MVAHTIALQHSHVLIHCSDGWDRTSQLSALAQLCLDPYYRTTDGFIVLVEKDWLSFGHMFRSRSGLLSHENWFEVQNERSSANRNSTGGDASDSSSNPFEKAITKAQDMWRRRHEGSGDLDADSDSVESPSAPKRNPKLDTKLKDTSPVFHQFLDAVHQLQRQFPTRFEFNERFLRRLLYHVYSCQYGTFLYDCEKERVEAKAKDRTRSVWEYFLAKKHQFQNEDYDPIIDDNDRDRTSLILPDSSNVKWWHQLFGRKDEEMNQPEPGPLAPLPPRWDGATGAEMELAEESEQGFGTVSQAVLYGIEGQASARSSTVNRFARMDNSRHGESVVTDPLSSALFANDGLQRDGGTLTDPLTSGLTGTTRTAEVEMR
jgi:myotubularin-related protein 6/7/8